MLSNNNNVYKLTIDETFLPFWKKSEFNVIDDLFVALQNLVAGTATVSNTRLNESCFQYKIHLSEHFPLITLQYEMKSDINIEITHTIPVVVDENNGLNHDSTEFSNEITYRKLMENSFPFCNIKKEIPEGICVSDFCEVITDEKLVSYDCSQNNKIIVSHSEMNICNKSPAYFLSKPDSNVSSTIRKKLNMMLEDNSQLIVSPIKEQKNCKNVTRKKMSKGILKKDGMKKHKERSELKEKKHPCSYCGKWFGKNSAKLQHERIHTGEKPFTCEECGKSYTRLFKLKEHKRIHTGEKPFKCDVCDKAFTQSGSLIAHKRIHTGKGLFMCDVCGKGFTRPCSLSIHKRIHTGERLFTCDECGKAFTQSGSLKTHKKIHTGEKHFQCEVCGKAFLLSTHLNTHKKTHVHRTSLST